MTTHASTRYDLYGPVHKALRAQLCDALLRTGRLDLADPGEIDRTCAVVEALAATLRSHLAHEAEFIHPLMDALAAGSAHQAEHEHEHHLRDIAQVEKLVARLREKQDDPALRALYRAVSLLLADNLTHMEMEESQHQELLWARCGDDELAALEGRIVAALAPQESMALMGWMLPALTPAQRAGLLSGMREQAPPPVFEAVLGIARTQLDATGWHKLNRALDLAPVPGLVAA
jgi:hypothetical protein